MRTFLSILVVTLVVFNQNGFTAAEVGSAAPKFTLTDTNGSSHNLSDFKGKYVVLEWVNHGCPFVKKFYNPGKMQEFQKTWTGKDVVWLSICSSAPGKQGHMSAEEWNEKIKATGTKATAVLMDEDGTVGQQYGAKTTPHMYVIDPKGTLIYAGAIDDKKSTDPADIEGATNYVHQALQEAMAGKGVSTTSTAPYGCSVKY